MKRRIIVDMSALYEHQSIVYGASIDMNTVRHKGYMVLGAFLHLIQDMQAHRAMVTQDMIYAKDDGTQYYGYTMMVESKEESKICGGHIRGVGEQIYTKYWELYNKLKNEKSIPIVKLKNYLVRTNLDGNEEKDDGYKKIAAINIEYMGKSYPCSSSQAYEDNPLFYQDRYSTAYDFSCAYIDRMNNDRGYYTSEHSYYGSSKVPLYERSWN